MWKLLNGFERWVNWGKKHCIDLCYWNRAWHYSHAYFPKKCGRGGDRRRRWHTGAADWKGYNRIITVTTTQCVLLYKFIASCIVNDVWVRVVFSCFQTSLMYALPNIAREHFFVGVGPCCSIDISCYSFMFYSIIPDFRWQKSFSSPIWSHTLHTYRNK